MNESYCKIVEYKKKNGNESTIFEHNIGAYY